MRKRVKVNQHCSYEKGAVYDLEVTKDVTVCLAHARPPKDIELKAGTRLTGMFEMVTVSSGMRGFYVDEYNDLIFFLPAEVVVVKPEAVSA